ncbi:MAG TPA: thioredoxin domain-containing protein [Solirubrobacteraceae bacterium]|nr:thioredoxin domain-containing protein [Solirubrobacteraceae bacterium]
MPNALARETSPYLRQHAENPVQWLPWGSEALEQAQARDVPLLVSIGYSSCHWCHVMEHESFEDPRVAAVMNEEFVCVKVDREERPDVDALYMEAVQGMTGHGGWPLNVFLTPEQVPFYGGTYFPPEPRPGMPAWTQVLQAIAETWRERKQEIRAGGEQLRERLGGGALLQPSDEPIQATSLTDAVEQLRHSFDSVQGGFGSPPTHAPKFPQAPVLEFLLARALAQTPNEDEPAGAEAQMALFTLRAMASGGIHDQVGGGFHRYAVDATWTVPHFEKMLYDNALLARAYLHGYRLSKDAQLASVCRDTLDWMLREMQGPEGGFYSALDADSEGVEGRYYVWRVAELEETLGDGEDAQQAIRWLGASEQGNFLDPHHPEPGLNVLENRGGTQAGRLGRPDTTAKERIRTRLLEARNRRVRPGLDDKRITSWNALAISALADAGSVLGERGYLDAAVRCAEFILRDLRDEEGRLLRTYSEGLPEGRPPSRGAGRQARLGAYLEDHAFLLEALMTLFEATCAERWLTEARALADETIARFGDPQRGGFFSTASDHEALIARRKDLEDSPIPSGASAAALGLLRLARATGEQHYEREAVGVLRLLHEIAPRHPSSFGHLLQAIQLYLFPAQWLACAVPAAATTPTGSDPTPTG